MIYQKILPFLKLKRFTDFSIYSFGQFINILSPLLITPYLIYTCGIENLGKIATGQSLAYILVVIVDYSSYIIGVKDVAVNRSNNEKLEQIFFSHYLSKLVLMMVVFFISLVLILFIPYFRNNWLLILFSLSIILGQAINPTWYFQGLEEFKWITIMNILSKILFFAGVFLLIKTNDDYIYSNLFLGMGSVISNTIGFLIIKSKFDFSSNNANWATSKKLLKDDFSFCMSQFFFALRNYSPVMIISFFAGNYIAGQFKIIEQIIGLFRTYLQMVFKFSYSIVCFEIDKSLKSGLQIWKKIHGLNFAFLMILLGITFLFSKEILVFFKVDLHLLNQLESYLKFSLLIPILIALTLAMEQIIFSLNKNNFYIRSTIFSTIFNIIAISLLIKYFSLKEVFILLIFTESMLFSIYLMFLKSVMHNLKK